MIEFYPQIKAAHVVAVLCSGGLFLLRGALVQVGAPAAVRVAMAAPTRYLSYGVDTALLTAALMLLTILPGAVFANGWLAVKLVLLVVYVVLGTLALRRGRTPAARRACYVAAILVFGFMLTVARTHQPLGAIAGWTG
jgi:uncharacterized membrane protein SirB2